MLHHGTGILRRKNIAGENFKSATFDSDMRSTKNVSTLNKVVTPIFKIQFKQWEQKRISRNPVERITLQIKTWRHFF